MGRFLRRLAIETRLVPDTGSMMSAEELATLEALACEVTTGCIVEIGSYRGRSASALARGVRRAGRQVAVYAIDPHEPFVGVNGGRFGPEDRGVFYRAMLRAGSYREVRLVNLPATEVAAGWRRPVGMLLIDGDHRYPAVLDDLRCWLPHVLADGIVVLDDMNNDGPARVVREATGAGLIRPVQRVGKMLVARRAAAEDAGQTPG